MTQNAKRFDVKMLLGRSEDDKGRETTRGVFQRKVSDRARKLWKRKGQWRRSYSGILSEMVKEVSCEEGFFHLLINLVHAAWYECRFPKEWSDAVLVPIPKKGNLGKCDNWKGISLLDVMGKVVARIFQEWLQKLAEDVLPE